MPRLRPCVEWIVETKRPCGELSHESRCPEHKREYERQRFESEPWRHLYDHPRYFRARAKVFARDGYRCTFTVGSRRCISDALIECHHEEKLRLIWARCGSPQRGGVNWNKFVVAATDLRKLTTLCTEHHKFVDMNKPIEQRMPGPGARAQTKRSIRSRKRRSLPKDRRPRKRGVDHED